MKDFLVMQKDDYIKV
jgi:hypothetical protein